MRREQAAFKVKSILKGTVYEGLYFLIFSTFEANRRTVSRQDLVGWLQHQIAEQKRVDLATSGSSAYPDALTVPVPSKDASAPEVQLILPVDTRKQKKHVKQILLDRGNANHKCDFKSTDVCLAYEKAGHLKTAAQNGLPMLAVDVPNAVFDTLMKNASWITDEETWKGITASMPTVHMAYAQQIREAAAKRKAEGFPYLLLYATREERMQILTLN